MARYLTMFLTGAALLLGGFAGFTLIIDPYDVVGAPRIEGVNARKTRTHEDGGRITKSHRILTTQAGALLLGNSRIVDGFPAEVADWPGELLNAGMRGANGFEIARTMVVGARNPAVRCIVIGLDLDDFDIRAKAKATYWITALPDANRLAGLTRMALSPHAFARALQTYEDNRTGGAEEAPWKESYPAGWQHQRFENALEGTLGYYRAYTYDPERFAFLARAAQGARAAGIQLIFFTHPVHAYREAAMDAAGLEEARDRLRADLAELAKGLSDGEVRKPCLEGPAAQFWDFSGYQSLAVVPPPGPKQSKTHYWYHEPHHYRETAGREILAQIAGRGEVEDFGLLVEPDIADGLAVKARNRARAWRERDEYGAKVWARLGAMSDQGGERGSFGSISTGMICARWSAMCDFWKKGRIGVESGARGPYTAALHAFGAWPNGKAAVFGTEDWRFEPSRPSHSLLKTRFS